jgi:hypothetical protein
MKGDNTMTELERRFNRFDEDNPYVWELFVRFC